MPNDEWRIQFAFMRCGKFEGNSDSLLDDEDDEGNNDDNVQQ